MAISSDTMVQITMGRFIGGIVALGLTFIGSTWAVAAIFTSGIKDDVGAIRETVQKLQGADKDSVLRLSEIELKTGEQIAGLRVDLATLGGKLDVTNKSVEALTGQIADLQRQTAARRASLGDPKIADAVVEALKAHGIDKSSVIVVPWDAGALSGK